MTAGSATRMMLRYRVATGMSRASLRLLRMISEDHVGSENRYSFLGAATSIDAASLAALLSAAIYSALHIELSR